MVLPADFAKNFAGHSMPKELEKLLAFDERADGSYYSDGFELVEDDKSGLASWSEDPAFLGGLLPFAQANGSGSFYALWAAGGGAPSEMPVVVFGDEGGVHVVAENVRALLQLLTFDVEPMIDHDEATFYKDEDDYEESDARPDYVAWLKKELDLEPIDAAKPLVARAQAKHKAAFDKWMSKYVSD